MTSARPRWWFPAIAVFLYFAQGFPFGVINELFPLYLREKGVSLAQIGLLSTVGLAWTWKVAWSPLVDLFGSYRRWMVGALVTIAGALAALSVVPPQQTSLFWSLVAVIAIASATQDIAIDALMVRITPDGALGPVNSARVAAYRGALIVAGGGLAALSAPAGWSGVLLIGAGIALGLAAGAFFTPAGDKSAQTRHANPFRGLAEWAKRPRAALLFALVLLYRLGDAALTPMVKPYWVDRGFTATEIGTVTTVIGLSFLIAGAIAGGLFIARFGLFRSLLVLGILQMLSNGGYGLAASFNLARPALYTATIVENFTGGLGTAAFLALLMSICDREHAATQYAMLSALFGLTRSVIGSVSGIAAERLGYANWFWLTMALALPGLALLPFVRDALRHETNVDATEVVMS